MTEPVGPELSGWRGLAHSVMDYGGTQLLRTLGLVGFAALLEGFGLVLLLPIVELIVSEKPSTDISAAIAGYLGAVGATSWVQRMAILFAGFFILMILRAAILLRRDVAIMRISLGFVDHTRQELLRSLVYSSWPQIQSLRKSHMLDSLTANIARIGMAMRFATQSSISVAMVCVFIGTAFFISVPAGLLLLATMVIACLLGAVWLARSKILGEGMTRGGQDIARETVRFLDGLKAAKATQAEEDFLKRFASAVRYTRKYGVDFSRQQGLMRRSVELLGAIVAMLLVALGYGVFNVSPVELLLIGGILIRLMPALTAAISGLQGVANALPAFDTAQRLKANAQYGKMRSTATQTAFAPDDMSGSLVIDGLAFRYDGGENILRCEHIALPATGLVTISGESGSGKTSLADLIAGLMVPQNGDIKFGKVSLNDNNRSLWQTQISYAVQDGFLFEGSVRENILWPDRSDDDALIWDALEQACVADIVRALPAGLDESLRSAGSRISGGERQRIALARAFLRPAKILILDESLSALDRQTSARLMANLQTRAQGQLILLISHAEAHADHSNCHITVTDGRANLVKDEGVKRGKL
ncbi:ATP-binding cassette domain-containing protein [Parasphingorhabdus sp. DH2-15]|uniref:ATP-binding cassette domain-containing protein n=1 Tax=Parasphingorhabdus sp. DH2-15 TaxID=3444112 RepID=UPI003F685824